MYSLTELLIELDRSVFRVIYEGLRPPDGASRAAERLSDKVDHFFIVANTLGEFWLVIPLIAVFWIAAKNGRVFTARLLLVALGLGLGMGALNLTKQIARRSRPYISFNQDVRHLQQPDRIREHRVGAGEFDPSDFGPTGAVVIRSREPLRLQRMGDIRLPYEQVLEPRAIPHTVPSGRYRVFTDPTPRDTGTRLLREELYVGPGRIVDLHLDLQAGEPVLRAAPDQAPLGAAIQLADAATRAEVVREELQQTRDETGEIVRNESGNPVTQWVDIWRTNLPIGSTAVLPPGRYRVEQPAPPHTNQALSRVITRTTLAAGDRLRIDYPHITGDPPRWEYRREDFGRGYDIWREPEPWLHEFIHIRTDIHDVWEAPLKSRGFPSGHTQFAFTLATILAYWFPRGAAGFWIWAWLCGLGRIYGGLHFPLDVVCGALVGWGSVAMIVALARAAVTTNKGDPLPLVVWLWLPLWGPFWLLNGLAQWWPPVAYGGMLWPLAAIGMVLHIVLLPIRVANLVLYCIGQFFVLIGEGLAWLACGREGFRAWLAPALPERFPRTRPARTTLSWRIVFVPVVAVASNMWWLGGVRIPMPPLRWWAIPLLPFLLVAWLLLLPFEVIRGTIITFRGSWFFPPLPEFPVWAMPLWPFVGVVLVVLLPFWIVRWVIAFLASDTEGRTRGWRQWIFVDLEDLDPVETRARHTATALARWLGGIAGVLLLLFMARLVPVLPEGVWAPDATVVALVAVASGLMVWFIMRIDLAEFLEWWWGADRTHHTHERDHGAPANPDLPPAVALPGSFAWSAPVEVHEPDDATDLGTLPAAVPTSV